MHLTSHTCLPFSQCHRSFSLHLPPTPFMLQIGAAGCHHVKLVAPRLAGMASFSWWHNVVAMSYAFKQWFDVTAVSAALSNAGDGCHIPAGKALSDKLMSAAQPPRPHKNSLASHTFMKVLIAWQNRIAFMYNNSLYTVWLLLIMFWSQHCYTQSGKCSNACDKHRWA